MTYIQDPKDIPTGEHWAILKRQGVHIPGDQRSREAPGHGYPERTEWYITYRAFTSEEEFRTELAKEFGGVWWGDGTARGIHVSATYSGKTTIAVEEAK